MPRGIGVRDGMTLNGGIISFERINVARAKKLLHANENKKERAKDESIDFMFLTRSVLIRGINFEIYTVDRLCCYERRM